MDSIKNFIVNIKPVMLKVKNDEPLTADERNQIVNFYIEVANLSVTPPCPKCASNNVHSKFSCNNCGAFFYNE